MKKIIKTILKPIFNILIIMGISIAGAVCLLCDFIDWILESEVDE